MTIIYTEYYRNLSYHWYNNLVYKQIIYYSKYVDGNYTDKLSLFERMSDVSRKLKLQSL